MQESVIWGEQLVPCLVSSGGECTIIHNHIHCIGTCKYVYIKYRSIFLHVMQGSAASVVMDQCTS